MGTTRGAFLLVVVLAAGCRTPYQSMGFRGGHRGQRLGEGRYLVEVRVNAFTSSGTALEYLHRRAGELCRSAGYTSYVVEDRASGADYVATEHGVASKPEVSAVVRCTEPRRPQQRTARPPSAAVDKGGWHCTVASSDVYFSFCYRDVARCRKTRRTALERFDLRLEECSWQMRVACFRYRGRLSGGEALRCAHTLSACDRTRDGIDVRDYEPLSDCRAVE